MTKIKIILAFIIALFTSQLSAQDSISQPYIEVSSTVERKVIPDNIYLDLTIKETKSRTIDQIELDVLRSLKKASIPEERLSLQDAASDLINVWYKKDNMEAQKKYQLLLHDTKEIGNVMSAMDFPGIETLSIAHLDYSKEDELNLELAAEAMAKAKQKANAMLKAIGKEVGQPLIVREERIYAPRRNETLQAKVSMSASSDYIRPDISFNKETYNYQVFVRFSIKQ